MAVVSDGRVYQDTPAILEEEGGWPSPSTCAWPTPMQADLLAGILRTRKLSAVSIGSGEGAFESMLENRGVSIVAVDLDVLTDTSMYRSIRRFCAGPVRRIRPDALFRISAPPTTAICFFWGRSTPWREYLLRYPDIASVCIVGEPAAADAPCATEPRGGALDGISGWKVCHRGPIRAVHPAATISVYVRKNDRDSNSA